MVRRGYVGCDWLLTSIVACMYCTLAVNGTMCKLNAMFVMDDRLHFTWFRGNDSCSWIVITIISARQEVTPQGRTRCSPVPNSPVRTLHEEAPPALEGTMAAFTGFILGRAMATTTGLSLASQVSSLCDAVPFVVAFRRSSMHPNFITKVHSGLRSFQQPHLICVHPENAPGY